MKENGSFQAHSISGLPPRYWLWALASHQDKIYGTAYIHTKAEGFAVRLFNSEDGFKWSEICKFPVSGNETFIDFDIEGNLYGIIRMEAPPFHPYFVRFPAPVSDKHTISVLPTVFQGPFIKRLEGGCLLVGRRWDKLDGARRVDMLWLDDSGQLGYIATLPSGGDCSYASYAQTGPKNAIICYYSTHEHLSSGSETGDIYMARLSLGLS